MLNRADGSVVGLSDPGFDGFAVTPLDSGDLPAVTRALWIGTGGDVSVVMAGGNVLTFKSVASGSVLPVQVSRVKLTGTTALHIVGLI